MTSQNTVFKVGELMDGGHPAKVKCCSAFSLIISINAETTLKKVQNGEKINIQVSGAPGRLQKKHI